MLIDNSFAYRGEFLLLAARELRGGFEKLFHLADRSCLELDHFNLESTPISLVIVALILNFADPVLNRLETIM